MGRILVEGILLLAIVVGVVVLARGIDINQRQRRPLPALGAPPEARWRASHHGAEPGLTTVLLTLQLPRDPTIYDQHVFGTIADDDTDYEQLLYTAMENARARAVVLNSIRNSDLE